MNRRCFVLAALALGGCATIPPPAVAPGPLGELEPLYAVETGREGLTIRVASGGCTARPDFTFYVDRRAGAVSLAFARKHVDVCKTGPGQAEVAFTWAELGLAQRTSVFLLNPVASR
ncbi:hypothetical protein [Phenylobacterium sp.]|uniref:hypothetical protein n=1 Tax=Phenylobacterium sp. TaxID=1871053 RepID=UPI0025F5C710|nr:hypothetical protein [Phenylobacterium sp.]